MGKGEGEARREEGGDGRKGEDGKWRGGEGRGVEGRARKGVRFFFSADLATLSVRPGDMRSTAHQYSCTQQSNSLGTLVTLARMLQASSNRSCQSTSMSAAKYLVN